MEFINENSWKQKKSWTSVKEKSAEDILWKEFEKRGEKNPSNSSFKSAQSIRQKREVNSVSTTQEGIAVAGGTNTVLNALAAYLRYSEGTTRDDWQE